MTLLLVLRGVIALVFGLLALLWPEATVLVLALLFGAYAAVDGFGMIASGLGRDGDQGRRWLYVLGGIVGIAAGVTAVVWPQLTALALVVLAGAWAVVTGVLEIVAAIRLRRELTGEWLIGLLGTISLIAGVIILLRPDVGAVALATVLGVYAIVAGVVLLLAAWRLRKAQVVVLDLP
ncbi:HdeD family acid-resistance protein [Modestobacter lacusdianchii]